MRQLGLVPKKRLYLVSEAAWPCTYQNLILCLAETAWPCTQQRFHLVSSWDSLALYLAMTLSCVELRKLGCVPSNDLVLCLAETAWPCTLYLRLHFLVPSNDLISSPDVKSPWWAYRIGRPPSSVCPSSVCRPYSLNIFSSETTGPMKVKFHMDLQDGGTKVCLNCPGHMPIHCKKLKKSSSPEPKGTKRLMTFKLGNQHRVLEYYQVCSNYDPGLTLTYLRQGQIWSLMLLYGKRVKQRIFLKVL